MIVKFAKDELESYFVTPISELRGKQHYPLDVILQFKKKVQLLITITKLEELKYFRSLHFEYLKDDRKGQCSVRLNKQYRLIFVPVNENELRVLIVKEISKHYE